MQVPTLTKQEEDMLIDLKKKKMLACSLNLILEECFFLSSPNGTEVPSEIPHLVPGCFFFFFLCHIHKLLLCRGKENTHAHTSPVVNNVIYWLIFPDPDIDAASAMMLLNSPPEIQAGCE